MRERTAQWLFLVPGRLLIVLGLIGYAVALPGFNIHGVNFDLNTLLFATLALLGDVLDLAHRLPLTWRLVRELRVPVRLGREAARVSRDLDVVAAGHADRLLTWQPRRLNPHRIGVLVHEARLYADPDRAIADHDAALAARRVEVHHEQGAPGVSEVFMSLDTADAVAFDHTVSTMATTMKAAAMSPPKDTPQIVAEARWRASSASRTWAT
mgnify:CR=1 FL=1